MMAVLRFFIEMFLLSYSLVGWSLYMFPWFCFSGMPSSSLWSASENMVIYRRCQFILTTKAPRGSKGRSCIPLITATSTRMLHLNYLGERRLLLLGTKNQLLTWLSSAPRLIKVTSDLLQTHTYMHMYI